MYGEVKVRLQAELEAIREAGLWKAERVIEGPQGAQVAVAGREVLNFCANNYLGLADRSHAGARGPGRTRALGLRAGQRAVHLRHPDDRTSELEAAIAQLPRHRGRDPLHLLLRRQRRAVRDAARRAGRHHLRRAQPRLDHRRHPSLQGERATATRTTTWPSWSRRLKETAGARMRMIATDGVFSMDGDIAPLLDDLRPGGAATTRW